jgi:glucose/arabinose dehydrogenase
VASTDNGGIQLPEGFGAAVVADEVAPRLRHLVVHPSGDLYLKLGKLQDGHGILALRDTNDDGRMDLTQGFADYTGTGIGLHDGYLYASSDVAVHRYPLVTGSLLPDTAAMETVVSGFPEQRSHAAKSFTFDESGHLFVNVGAPSNACQEKDRQPGAPGQDPCPLLETHGGIWRYQADQLGQTHQASQRYATGLRNCVALKWSPTTQSLYAVQHGRDQLGQLWPDLYTEEVSAILPAEELVQIDFGDDFGWPYCYFDWRKPAKVLAPEYGGDGEEVGRCADKKDPIMGFPGHMAPNDLLFYQGEQFPAKYRQGAFIAFHGSWNRAPEPQGGYFVAFVPMEDGKPSGEWEIFAEGFPQKEIVNSPENATYRPMGLAEGPDGSLYIVDSKVGRIWRVGYYGTPLADNQ